MTALLTLRWFTDFPYRTAHAMLEGGFAACDSRIFTHWLESPYWKSDMPESITACPACEKILAGE